jgi:hypothetical protein
MSINQARRATHRVTVLLGDAQAVKRGRFIERLTNRVMGRLTARLTRNLWR